MKYFCFRPTTAREGHPGTRTSRPRICIFRPTAVRQTPVPRPKKNHRTTHMSLRSGKAKCFKKKKKGARRADRMRRSTATVTAHRPVSAARPTRERRSPRLGRPTHAPCAADALRGTRGARTPRAARYVRPTRRTRPVGGSSHPGRARASVTGGPVQPTRRTPEAKGSLNRSQRGNCSAEYNTPPGT